MLASGCDIAKYKDRQRPTDYSDVCVCLHCPSVCPSGVLDEQLKVKMVKDKLLSKPCRNQGFVLDSFPETCEQARELFSCEAPQTHPQPTPSPSPHPQPHP